MEAKLIGILTKIFANWFSVALLLTIGWIKSICSDCLLPGVDFPNGKIIYENLGDFNLTSAPVDYVLKFRCRRGYERIGLQFVVCIGDRWNSELPSCLLLECPEPPPIGNGTFENGRRVVGSLTHYKCNTGFELMNKDASLLTCTLNSTYVQWSGEMPVCLGKTSCPDPGISAHGKRQGSCCFTGDSVYYSCNVDYELIGPNAISCHIGGIWSAERPRCKPLNNHCPDPPHIKNGTTQGSKTGDFYAPYDEVEVICDPGFAHFGSSEFIMCEEDFKWDIDFGECRETFCPAPELPLNGSIVEMESNNATFFKYKHELTYVCDEGFRLIGSTYRTCDKGNWTGSDPRCEAIKCYNPGQPEHGNRAGDNFSVGQKVSFTCFQGFELIGSSERFCLPNGQWSGELTRCNLQSNYCPDPGIPINGRKIGNSYNEGDKVRFRCYPGFSLIGSNKRECLHNREWSGDEATCLGAFDFDNPSDVSQTLKVTMSETAENQEMEIIKFNSQLSSFKGVTVDGKPKAIQTQRILDMNYPGRYILYLVFDVSGSVREKNFRTSIKFAKSLVKKVGISENGARAGALTFSSKAEVEFNPVQYSTTESVLEALDRINYTKGGTATSSVLRLILKESMPLTRAYLGRKGVKSVIFLLTDGKANMGGDPEEQAEKLKEAGVEIYCIGITGNIMKNALYKLASQPTEEHVFVLNNYKTLEWLVQEITNGTIDYSQCGLGLDKVGKSGQHSRMVGGIKVVEPWPWMAALYISDSGPNEAELKCGGSIVGQRWVLTAAHCICKKEEVTHRDIFQVTVKLGLTDVANYTHLQEFEARRFFTHHAYNPANFDNDIALIQLNGLIRYNAYVRPICLPSPIIDEGSPLYKTSENAYAAGWGHSEVVRNGEIVNVRALKNLKELRLPIQSEKRCLQSLLDYGGNKEQFTNSMICAGTGDGSGDTCVGDSGGPLMQQQLNSDGNIFWTQVGLVSWGLGCNLANTYGFYTNVHSELDWINNVLKTVNE